MTTTYIVACVISGAALAAFLATGGVMLYAAYHHNYRYLPIHLLMMLVQFSIMGFLAWKCGP